MTTLTPLPILKNDLFSSQLPEWPEDLMPPIAAAVAKRQAMIIVIDDDPTGCQTVHEVRLATQWNVDLLKEEMRRGSGLLFLLANTRSVSASDARRINQEIVENLRVAAGQTGLDFVVVSRGDSTLRGHFREEAETLASAPGVDAEVILFAPSFGEGGRYTCNNVHYVEMDQMLVPAGQTESARDSTFGYKSSNLVEWLSEQELTRFDKVASIDLDLIRSEGPVAVAKRLMQIEAGSTCIINAISRTDIEVCVAAILSAENEGRRFLYRTAATFVAVRMGQRPSPLLTPEQLHIPGSAGGLIVVGSHVPRSTQQLEALRQSGKVVEVEIDASGLVGDERRNVIRRTAEDVDKNIAAGKDVVLFTSRTLLLGSDGNRSLEISRRVARGVAAVLQQLQTPPAYVIAKGGITSHHIAVGGLGMIVGEVIGQIQPGAPVWRLGSESKFPDLCFIVYPGNVGQPHDLADLVTALKTN